MDITAHEGRLRLPFSVYDIFGYIIPGATFLLSTFAFEHYALKHVVQPPASHATPRFLHLPIHTAITEILPPVTDNWVLAAGYLFVILTIAYVVGHLISSLSSALLDRLLIGKAHGYPFRNLLRIDKPDSQHVKLDKAYYRGAIFWFNAYLLALYGSHAFRLPRLHLDVVARFLLWLFFVGVLSKAVVAAILHRLRRHHEKSANQPERSGASPRTNTVAALLSPTGTYVNATIAQLARATRPIRSPVAGALRFVAGMIVKVLWGGIYHAINDLLASLFQTRGSFSNEFLERFRKHFQSTFHLDADSERTNVYWLTRMHVEVTLPSVHTELMRSDTLYRFTRNLATALYLVFIYIMLFIMLQEDAFCFNRDDMLIRVSGLAFWACALWMAARYYYILVCRYSKNLYRAFVYAVERESALGREKVRS